MTHDEFLARKIDAGFFSDVDEELRKVDPDDQVAADAHRRVPPRVRERVDGKAEVGVLVSSDLCKAVEEHTADQVQPRPNLSLDSRQRVRDGLVGGNVIKSPGV